MNRFGFVRVTCASIRTSVANPEANAAEIIRVLDQVADSDIVLFPELCITGYTCADLFGQASLLQGGLRGSSPDRRGDDRAAAARRRRAAGAGGQQPFQLRRGAVRTARSWGVVPKQYIPNYKEFYESRWFRPADGSEPAEIEFPGGRVPFGIDLLFDVQGARRVLPSWWASRFARTSGCRIPPSSIQAGAGATILLNLSASNETIGKSQYRTDLVVGQSGRCIAAYAYAGAGPSESTTDLVFSGHCLIAENGRLPRGVAPGGRRPDDSPRLATGSPRTWTSPSSSRTGGSRPASSRGRGSPGRSGAFGFELAPEMPGLKRFVPGTPFVPAGRARAAPPLRRDFRHPVRGAGQADRAASPGHSAEHRRLRRARLHALAARGRQDVRPAGDRPAPGSRSDDARLRHHAAGPGTTRST